MCTVVVAKNVHNEFPLVVGMTRDEVKGRQFDIWSPTAEEVAWAGRDVPSGGTWKGVTSRGFACALTNEDTDDPVSPTAPSRGAVVARLLSVEDVNVACDYLAALSERHGPDINPFNVVVGFPDRLRIVSVGKTGVTDMRVHDGVTVLTNGPGYESRKAMAEALASRVGPNDPFDVVMAKMRETLSYHGPTWRDSVCVHKATGHMTLSASVLLVGKSTSTLWRTDGPACDSGSNSNLVTLSRL